MKNAIISFLFKPKETSDFENLYRKVKKLNRSKQAMLHDARRKYMLERTLSSKENLQEAKSWAIAIDNRCVAILNGC
ncbi:hypothetical protein ACPV5U_19150 [Vibrio mediterranei]